MATGIEVPEPGMIHDLRWELSVGAFNLKVLGQMPQPPEGRHLGALKPPFPLGMPSGRTAPAEIRRCTLVVQHDGHWGSGSWADNLRCSNSHWHCRHLYS